MSESNWTHEILGGVTLLFSGFWATHRRRINKLEDEKLSKEVFEEFKENINNNLSIIRDTVTRNEETSQKLLDNFSRRKSDFGEPQK